MVVIERGICEVGREPGRTGESESADIVTDKPHDDHAISQIKENENKNTR